MTPNIGGVLAPGLAGSSYSARPALRTRDTRNRRPPPITERDFPPLPEKGQTGAGTRPGPASSKGKKPDSCRVSVTRLDTGVEPGASGSGLRREDSAASLSSLPVDDDVEFVDAESAGADEKGRKRRRKKRGKRKTIPSQPPLDLRRKSRRRKGVGDPPRTPRTRGSSRRKPYPERPRPKGPNSWPGIIGRYSIPRYSSPPIGHPEPRIRPWDDRRS